MRMAGSDAMWFVLTDHVACYLKPAGRARAAATHKGWALGFIMHACISAACWRWIRASAFICTTISLGAGSDMYLYSYN